MNTVWPRIISYGELIRINRPIGILLLLWPALWALWLAGSGTPDVVVVMIFVAGTVLMRSAGCAINDYADRELDCHVARTCERPLATGKMSPREALMVFVVLSLAAFALGLMLFVTTLLLNVIALHVVRKYREQYE